jgi:magnesium chelatase family protein
MAETKVRAIGFFGDKAEAIEVTAKSADGWTVRLTGESDATPRDKETQVRVRAALAHRGLAPTGAAFRAVGVDGKLAPLDGAVLHAALIVAGHVDEASTQRTAVYADVSLTGELRPARGVYAAVMAASELDFVRIIVAPGSRAEAVAAVADGALCEVVVAPDVLAIADALNGIVSGTPMKAGNGDASSASLSGREASTCDFNDLRLPPVAVRGLTIALAGGHNIALLANPGCGAVMLARRLVGLVDYPRRTRMGARKLASIAGLFESSQTLASAPFRAPHHTVSEAGMIGGGVPARPGEVSLAHGGVLLLDEVDEFRASVLGSTWYAIARGQTEHIRASRSVTFAARPAIVVATTKVCPCGSTKCKCTAAQKLRHGERVWRACGAKCDVQIELPTFNIGESPWPSVSSADMAARIAGARDRRDALVEAGATEFTDAVDVAIERATGDDPLSASSAIARMALTIAALDGASAVTVEHVNEAATYRCLAHAALSQGERGVEVAS